MEKLKEKLLSEIQSGSRAGSRAGGLQNGNRLVKMCLSKKSIPYSLRLLEVGGVELFIMTNNQFAANVRRWAIRGRNAQK